CSTDGGRSGESSPETRTLGTRARRRRGDGRPRERKRPSARSFGCGDPWSPRHPRGWPPQPFSSVVLLAAQRENATTVTLGAVMPRVNPGTTPSAFGFEFHPARGGGHKHENARYAGGGSRNAWKTLSSTGDWSMGQAPPCPVRRCQA